MNFTHSSSLSWQTGILRFKNQSLDEVRQMLESQYGTRINLFPELMDQSQSLDNGVEKPSESHEIRLVLYLNYEPGTDDLMIMGAVR